MTLEELVRELGELPTMMTVEQELDVIRRLSSVPDEDILGNLDRFLALLNDLYISHVGDAIFGVDASNLDEFKGFAARLRRLASAVESAHTAELMNNTADSFSEEFSM